MTVCCMKKLLYATLNIVANITEGVTAWLNLNMPLVNTENERSVVKLLSIFLPLYEVLVHISSSTG